MDTAGVFLGFTSVLDSRVIYHQYHCLMGRSLVTIKP